MKKCPFCAEDIQDAAIKCRYCGSELNTPPKPSAPPVRRFQNVTESDARLLDDGAVIELQAGGRITQRVEELLAEKHVTVLRAAPPVNVVPTGSPVTGSENSALQKPVGRRMGLGLMAVVVGFILTIISSVTAGFGVLVLWVGLALAMKGSAITRWGGGFFLALIFGAIGMSIGRTSTPSTSTSLSGRTASTPSTRTAATPSQPSEATHQLALISSRGYVSEGGGYHIVEGQVKNVSDASLKNVTAVATWFDKDGGFIKSDNAIIEYNPILPGQTSPFKTMSSSNPAMSKYSVQFKTLFGGTLAVDDRRAK